MNNRDQDILKSLYLESFSNQRVLAEVTGYSLGSVNKSIKNLIQEGYLDENIKLTNLTREVFKLRKPRNAIILAAGFGMRMVPINTQTPKALLEVNGEPLVERIIKQLHDIGIKEIYIVVGFMKEQFEYLIDKYNVELVVNEEYASKNNLHSLRLVEEHLGNTYIVPCDIWSSRNPFSLYEIYSWYMVTDLLVNDSDVRVNRKMELVSVSDIQHGNSMIGIAYLTGEEAGKVRKRLTQLDADKRYNNAFWEETLYEEGKMILPARVVRSVNVQEIDTYEQLRELDEKSNHLKSDAISLIEETLNVSNSDIEEIMVLKKGMTNRSFLFVCNGKKYIMRIPGAGTDQLIDRRKEAAVYEVINKRDISENVVYMNPDNGYKIAEFLEDSRVCNPENVEDLHLCMKKLKELHSLELRVDHTFDIFKQIIFYEELWDGTPSIYRDYKKTKESVFSLKKYIDEQEKAFCLTHIDAVPDNFILTEQGEVRLIDWEYAGMQDPHVDIAMFCIYSLYSKNQIDKLIDIYFDGDCKLNVRIKIYCYISVCGLLWSNWCEYKRSLGVEFGQYSLRQYRYAKEYYRIAMEEIERCTE